MTGFASEQCRSCNAAIIWATSERRLSPMPINAEPAKDGTIQLIPRPDFPPLARVLSRPADRFGKTLYVSHFATCKDADRWRKAGAR